MTTTAHGPAPREGMSLSSDRFPPIGTSISVYLGALFHLSFFAILAMLRLNTTLRLDTS